MKIIDSLLIGALHIVLFLAGTAIGHLITFAYRYNAGGDIGCVAYSINESVNSLIFMLFIFVIMLIIRYAMED
jgi:hypothetical protein